MDSSRLVVCSGLAPWREGSWARCSFSTWICDVLVSADLFPFSLFHKLEDSRRVWFVVGTGIVAYRNLEIDHLLGESRHLVVEAECVLANTLGSEDEITLALLCSV